MRGLFGKYYESTNSANYNYGATIIKGDGDNYYLTRGNYSDDFIKWNEKTGKVTRLARTPTGMFQGGSTVYLPDKNEIYLTGSLYAPALFAYDINSNTWREEINDPLPNEARYGSSMIYDGSRYIYYNRGGNSNLFYRYDTQGQEGEIWEQLESSAQVLGYGSKMILYNNYIYVLRGQNVNPNPFMRYSLEEPTGWEIIDDAPFSVHIGGYLENGGNDNFYIASGNHTREFYRYNTLNQTWDTLPNSPGSIQAGGAAASNHNGLLYTIPGAGNTSYQDSIYTYVMETENTSFRNEGTYISESYDLTSVYRWAGFSINYELPTNTNIKIETATSEDELSWSSWTEVNRKRKVNDTYSFRINSQPNRFIKIKITLLSGDGISSPKIESYSINYYQDIDAPNNPSVEGIQALGSTDPEISITSGTWYNYPEPTFEWAEAEDVLGATDGTNGSGVNGYHIYWGTNSDAIPEIDGEFQIENSFSPTNLLSGNEYFLKIQTEDNAGNISEDILDAFSYKFDTSLPASPTNLTSDPSGYTATNNFSFTWDLVTKDGANIIEYCYKTGATSGEFSIERCIEETNIDEIEAYRVGSNIFMVRAKDQAGNIGPYTTVSYFFVDAENAPAPPRNLTVTPENSITNSFGFEWDPPAAGTFYGSVSNLSYLFSVNALPTEYSTTATSLRYLIPGAYATLPGENIFYIVSRDEAGNVNYNDYTSVSFFANTVAPGIPIDMEIADVSVKSTASWRLAISWDPPIEEGSGVATYRIYRSTDGENFTHHTTTGGSSLVDTKLEQKVHYYKTQACDSTNNCGAFSEVVSMYPDGRYVTPPEMIIEPVMYDIGPKKATVKWVTDRTSDSRIAYGLESGKYFEEETSNSEHVIEHILNLHNLTPGTKYYYIVKWTDEDGNTGISEEGTFETSPPPTIEEPVVRNVGLSSALIQFKTKDANMVRIFYGESSAFGGMIEMYTGLAESLHNAEIPDLKDGTKYYFKINTFDIDGSEYEGETHSFETLPRPEISDSKIYQVTGTAQTTLLVEWTVNTPVSSVVTYYPSNNPERVQDQVNVKLKAGAHRMILTNLEPNVPYTIVASGRDFMGNEASSGTLQFTTAEDTRPPKIFDLEVNPEIIGTGSESTAQLVISYKTDEPATSQVEYGEGTGTIYTQKTQEDRNYAEHHIVIVSGLTPGRVYHLRSVSRDPAGNVGYSVDKVVVTPSSSDNALDLAIRNLTSIFSFLGRR